MKTILVATFFVLGFTICDAQNKNSVTSLVASDLKFRSTFGFKPADSETVFSILGNGFFGTSKSDDADSIIRAWIKVHPQAAVIPVTSFSPVKVADTKSNMIYCWIVDNGDTLNNHLVKNGGFPAASMRRPDTWQEMSDKEKEMYKKNTKPVVSVYIAERDYNIFMQQISSAEKFAKKNNRGVWNENK